MNRRAYILLLLFAAWPVNLLFMWFMHMDRGSYRPFLFNSEEAGLQWYLWHVGGSSAYILIFWALWLYITGNFKRDRDVITAFGAIFIVQISDLIHYVGWQRHCHTVVFLQCFVILFSFLILLDRQLKKRYGNKC